jgi:hypothetical protein
MAKQTEKTPTFSNDHEMRDYERHAMVEGIINRRGDGQIPPNPPPRPKWQAQKGLCRLGLNGTQHGVMHCLIDHANQHTGRCDPSEARIAAWTKRNERTARDAIAKLSDRKLIDIVPIKSKNGRRNAYTINWKRLFEAYAEFAPFETSEGEDRRKVAGG